jgi:hypothetical protein
MEPDFVETYAIDLMPTATEEELKNAVPLSYYLPPIGRTVDQGRRFEH